MRSRRTVHVLVLAAVLALLPLRPLDSAGMQTHAWMAVTAIDHVDDPRLADLLRANEPYVRFGARFPDSGYFPGNTYGETAHWQEFHDAYLDVLLARTDCGDVTDPAGPCADDIAFYMGIIGHGAGDEVWDWLFEPLSPDLGEYYSHPELEAFNDAGGQELTMDIVALGVYDAGGPLPVPEVPSIPDLQSAFALAGLAGVGSTELSNSTTIVEVAQQAEQAWVENHLEGVLEAMPVLSRNLVDGPGGVEYASLAIAGQWNRTWDRLLGTDSPMTVSVHHPTADARGVPATGWVRGSYQPGSAPGRGGARTRIAVSLTDALPFGRAGGPPVSTELPAGSMTLTAEATGEELPIMAGYPKAVPYGAGSGTHTAALQPAVELEPCAWYRVDVTDALLDADGDPVTPMSWRFRTGLVAAGTLCADDPTPPPTTDLPTTTTPQPTTTTQAQTPTTTGGSAPGGGSDPAVGPAAGATPVQGRPTYTG